MPRRALLVAVVLCSLVGGVRAAGDHLRAAATDPTPRHAVLRQGIALDAAILPPRVDAGLTLRSEVFPGLTAASAAAAQPVSLRERLLAGTGPGDDARQLRRGSWAGLRAPPRLLVAD